MRVAPRLSRRREHTPRSSLRTPHGISSPSGWGSLGRTGCLQRRRPCSCSRLGVRSLPIRRAWPPWTERRRRRWPPRCQRRSPQGRLPAWTGAGSPLRRTSAWAPSAVRVGLSSALMPPAFCGARVCRLSIFAKRGPSRSRRPTSLRRPAVAEPRLRAGGQTLANLKATQAPRRCLGVWCGTSSLGRRCAPSSRRACAGRRPHAASRTARAS
mmetsp:Transcript_80272/g.233101  ORF Transcript_80272/g.233101 Transcript_80272/m.233101 type:complete len:212 (+) Transcript_80272:441-1076(+)